MPRITWLELNASYAHSSLALPSLHAQTLGRKEFDSFEWCKVSGTLKSRTVDLVEELIASDPDIVLATAWLFTHEQLLHVLSRFKTLRPNTVVFLGGPEFLGDNQAYLIQNSFVDGVFRGEGDLFLLQWGSIWNDRFRWTEVQGLCFQSADGTYRDGGLSRIECFDRLVPPEYSCFFPLDKAFVQMETTRGCFNTCAFCVSGRDRPVRRISMDRITEKLEYYVEKGIRQVRVLDRTFNSSNDYAVELLRLFLRYERKLSFHLEIHPALMTEALRRLLQEMPCGLLHLEAGLQSLSDEVLKESGRAGDTDKALDGLTFLFALENMETHTDLIAGLPLYTFDQTIKDVRTLVRMRAGEIQLESLKLLPGTELRHSAERLGLRFSLFPPYEVLETSLLSFAELQSLMSLSRLLDIYYNHSVWQSVFIELVDSTPDRLSEFVVFFRKKGLDGQLLSQERQGVVLAQFMNEQNRMFMPNLQETWIRSGLPLGKLPGLVETRSVKGEALEAYGLSLSCFSRVYEVKTDQTRWIVIYDRTVNQSLPVRVFEGVSDLF